MHMNIYIYVYLYHVYTVYISIDTTWYTARDTTSKNKRRAKYYSLAGELRTKILSSLVSGTNFVLRVMWSNSFSSDLPYLHPRIYIYFCHGWPVQTVYDIATTEGSKLHVHGHSKQCDVLDREQ